MSTMVVQHFSDLLSTTLNLRDLNLPGNKLIRKIFTRPIRHLVSRCYSPSYLGQNPRLLIKVAAGPFVRLWRLGS